MHIQTRIVDLIPDRDNIITTRLLVSSSDIGCLEGRDGSLSDMRRLTGANIQILPREELPLCVSGNDMLLQVCHYTFKFCKIPRFVTHQFFTLSGTLAWWFFIG